MHLEDVLAVHWQSLFVGGHGGDIEVFLFGAPGKREGMIGPESDRGHIQVCMLTGAEPQGASHANSDTEGIAWQDLNIGLGTAFTHISNEEASKAERSLGRY